MLSNDSARACYGTKHVEVAHEEYMAIQSFFFPLFRFQESKWRCILPLLQSFNFLCRILRILTCNKTSSRPQV
ncbi:hypothetical protein NC653_029002 [Populus alba x Populus x berolinensis]|uniref:Uncharacterized protein n=1 Tax=Populus alba x Populus x berolinensis TaxID=444605 RepID=A0AAD6Q2U9_9ROSI|nr:hypothetical protein NC653_029002 [Populus alba x Populus x berolinensis]